MTQQSGRVTISLDGDQLQSKSGASIKLGGVKREGMVTDQGTFVFKETLEHCEVKATIPHLKNTDLPALQKWTGVVLFETDTGVRYVSKGAVLQDPPELKDGESELTFIGAPAEPI